MVAIVEIPLSPATNQRFSVTLNEVTYLFRLMFDDAGDGCWILDVGTPDGKVLVAGIPLVSGADLLAQYTYLGIDGALILTTDRGAGEVPGFADLGVTSHLYFATAA